MPEEGGKDIQLSVCPGCGGEIESGYAFLRGAQRGSTTLEWSIREPAPAFLNPMPKGDKTLWRQRSHRTITKDRKVAFHCSNCNAVIIRDALPV